MSASLEASGRVFIVGLDGATFDVLAPLMAEGAMPVLDGLRRSGVAGPLRSTLPPFTAPAWTTFMTGKNPGKHGILHFVEQRNGQTGRILSSRDIPCATLWDLVGAHGRQVGVINLPLTYPAWPVRGWMISGMVTPPAGRAGVYPEDLSADLNGYQVDLPCFMGGKEFEPEHVPAPERLAGDLTGLVAKRAAVVARLLRDRPWDVAMVVFTETDRMGHYLWPEHASGASRGRLVREFYRILDAALGDVLRAAGDATILVMSDHGMGPAARRRVFLNDWLVRQGYLRLREERGVPRTLSSLARRIGISRDVAVQVASYLPRPLLQRLRRAGQDRLPLDEARNVAVFAPIYEFVGGIWLAPRLSAEERVAAADALRAELAALRDPDTGRSVVERIFPREEVFSGPHTIYLPDLIVLFHSDYVGSHRLGNPRLVSDRVEPGGVKVLGAHRSEGVLIAAGPGIVAGATVGAPGLEDLAPTVLHLIGAPIPDDMDGRVLEEMLAPELRRRPRRTEEARPELAQARLQAQAPDITAAEEAAMRQHLRGLGYL